MGKCSCTRYSDDDDEDGDEDEDDDDDDNDDDDDDDDDMTMMMMMMKDTTTLPGLYLPACIGRVDHRDVKALYSYNKTVSVAEKNFPLIRQSVR